MTYSKSSKRENDLLKIQQKRAMTYSKSSTRERMTYSKSSTREMTYSKSSKRGREREREIRNAREMEMR